MGIFLFTRYLPGLAVFLAVSGAGLMLILKAARGENSFGKADIKIPTWIIYAFGVLSQIPTIVYIYLGMKAALSLNP
jgi:hypothetical protein